MNWPIHFAVPPRRSILALLSLLCLGNGEPVFGALVGWYQFEEGRGTLARDAAGGNGQTPNAEPTDDDDGVIEGGPAFVPGIAPAGSPGFGAFALQLDGVDDRVSLGGGQDILSGVKGATYAAWVVSTAASTGIRDLIFVGTSRAHPTDSRFILQLLSDNRLRVGGRDDDSRFASLLAPEGTALQLGTTYHVAATVDFAANVFSLYLNGVLVRRGSDGNSLSANLTTPITPSTSSYVGGRVGNGTVFFEGILDDVRIYNEVVPASEIAALAVPEPSSVALFCTSTMLILGVRRRPSAQLK